MSLDAEKTFSFFPKNGPSPSAERAGFRFGAKGTHSSRTLMLAELEALLAAVARTVCCRTGRYAAWAWCRAMEGDG
jgi:hypothetical protein